MVMVVAARLVCVRTLMNRLLAGDDCLSKAGSSHWDWKVCQPGQPAVLHVSGRGAITVSLCRSSSCSRCAADLLSQLGLPPSSGQLCAALRYHHASPGLLAPLQTCTSKLNPQSRVQNLPHPELSPTLHCKCSQLRHHRVAAKRRAPRHNRGAAGGAGAAGAPRLANQLGHAGRTSPKPAPCSILLAVPVPLLASNQTLSPHLSKANQTVHNNKFNNFIVRDILDKSRSYII